MSLVAFACFPVIKRPHSIIWFAICCEVINATSVGVSPGAKVAKLHVITLKAFRYHIFSVVETNVEIFRAALGIEFVIEQRFLEQIYRSRMAVDVTECSTIWLHISRVWIEIFICQRFCKAKHSPIGVNSLNV